MTQSSDGSSYGSFSHSDLLQSAMLVDGERGCQRNRGAYQIWFWIIPTAIKPFKREPGSYTGCHCTCTEALHICLQTETRVCIEPIVCLFLAAFVYILLP